MKFDYKKLILIILLLLISSKNVFPMEFEPIRLEGENRILTSIEISKSVYEGSDTVILVEYNRPLDALLSTILSKKEDAPILVVSKDKIPVAVKEEIERLKATNAILIGDYNTFSKEAKKDLSFINIREISGQDIEEVAINMAKEVYGDQKDEVFLTLGYGAFADALSIGSISAIKDAPILLTNSEKISTTTLDALKDLKVKKVNIVGGKVAINEEVENQLLDLGIEFERTGGINREDTAREVSKKYNPSPKKAIIANGYNYADAMMGGYLAFKEDASILLTRQDNIDIETIDYLKDYISDITILGGEKAIDNKVEKDIQYILNGYVIKDEEKDIILPFNTITQEDNTLQKGKTQVKRQGLDGNGLMRQRVISENQKEIERRNISSKTIKKPVDKIILVGTLEIKRENLYFINKDLALRERPETYSKVLTTIPKGTHLDYVSSEKNFYKVKYKNFIGYLPSKDVKIGKGYKAGSTIIINKGYPISKDFNPGINPEALNALNKMKKDAKKDGISLNEFSTFRSYSYQVGLHKRYVRRDGKKKAETYSARPGHSEHQSGLAFDIGGADSRYYVSQKLGQMKEGLWMAKNAPNYGFILRYPKGKEKITGFSYEPWHFRYVGVDLAKNIQASGLTLDEYFGAIKPNY